jgi:hypothetical protein
VVALPKTVVHCAGRSLYHRIKTWFRRCLSAHHAEKLPNHGRILCLSIANLQLSLPKNLKSCELHPRELFMSRRTHGLVPPTRRLVPNPSRPKAPLFAARCEPRFPTRYFFSSYPIPSYANNLDPIHGSLPVGCALLMHAIATQARERAVPAALLATTLSRTRLSITPTQIPLLLMKADPTNSNR